jgi:RNA polymerase sigma factor (sigma-70 family)
LRKKRTDQHILDAIVSGERGRVDEAIDYLYTTHFDTISRFIQKNTGSIEEAADIFQDALVLFYIKVRKGEFQNTGNLKSYLFGISRNLWLKELRRRRIAAKGPSMADDHEYQEELFLQVSQVTIREVLELISKECKQLLMDFYFTGLSMSLIKSKYGLGSEAAAKNKKYRCLQNLIAMVKQRNIERSDFTNE